MAEAAISFAVEKLGDLLIEKVGFLRGVEGQLKWLKGELQSMRCFLKDAAEKQSNDERIRKWISDIRDVAQDAEDVIETFLLKVETPTRSRGLLEKCACFPKHVYHLDKIGQEIESIRARLQDINNSRQSYGIGSLDDGVVSSRMRSYHVSRGLSPWQRDKHLVGLEEDVKLLLHRAILEPREGLSIATIAGMGGIGKSTLARALYNHAALANKFECRAWVVVSEEFNLRKVIKELMEQLLGPEETKEVLEAMEILSEEGLKRMLHERLKGKQYFIVLDDVWQQEAWESLAAAFPDEQDKASRLLVTSRNRNVSKDVQYVHVMKSLDPNKSWQLFLNKALVDNLDGKCPPELEEIGRKIVKKCSGLPLAITVVGGLLREKGQSESGWKGILKGMDSHLGWSENPVSTILALSYHDLPPHLEACFLCFGFFKEDVVIRAKKLVHVWIAEGLISQEGGDDREMMEEIARRYLDELINRNMVQVKDLTKDGRIKKCQLHDLLRDLSIRKAKEEINFEVLREQGINSQASNRKSRHRAIYFSKTKRYSMCAPNNKHIRTLFFHGASDTIDINFKSFGLLRVLDLEGLGLRKLPNSISTLIGLRYLGLRGNRLKKLPKSLGCLKNLEVLDIRDISLSEVPDIVCKMDSLRHLYISFYSYVYEHLRIDTLKNLQTLMYINPDSLLLAHPTEMTSLRKLGIELNTDTNESSLWTALAMMENLMCLKLRWNPFYRPLPSLDRLVSLNGITQLKLNGLISTIPNASNFPPNISYLTLAFSHLKEDAIPVLEKLPKLLFLKLEYDAYDGEEMAISHDGFPRLKVLSFYWLKELRNISIERGAMPELKQLEIYKCQNLESLPEEVRLMSNLQELKMVTTPKIASKIRAQDFSNIPYVDLSHIYNF